jgi:phi13 family phage major tail protein
MAKVFEFRGVDNLYVAKVLTDDETGFTCDTPVKLAPVAEVGKTTDASNEAHYYDNKALIVVSSESADTITLTVAPPELEMLAKIIGRAFDPETGMMIDSPRTNDYYAIMYRTKGTDGEYRYVSRLKGQFNIPEETNATENDGTDTNNSSIEFTGIYTNHEFNKGKYDSTNKTWEKASAKGIVVDTRYGLADVSDFFGEVQTPDTVTVKAS